MPKAIEQLINILSLEELEQDLFRGISPDDGWQRVYGGQVIGQALIAAQKTVPTNSAHSLHGYFMRPGDPQKPIIYQVERLRDGKSFATRHVKATQHGHAIFTMTASFHKQETGLTHQIEMPVVPGPDDLPNEEEVKTRFFDKLPPLMRKYWQRQRPIEMRPVDLNRYLSSEHRAANQQIWIRATDALPDDQNLHKCVLAYASDFTILDTALIPHGRAVFDPKLQMASLDHAIWFHRPFKADEWLLYNQTNPSASGARGYCRGDIFTPEGTLVASVCQEGLIRERTETHK